MGRAHAEGTTLVVLAAGLGKRFGGLKQIAPVGPFGESLLSYSLHDAARAGFDRAVLVVRSEIRGEIIRHVRRFGAIRDLVAVDQDAFGPLRTTPWGTAHAIFACGDVITAPFGVVNADDLYGARAMMDLGNHLRGPRSGPRRAALVAYPIADTLSATGGVSRATIRVGAGNTLLRIVERTGVRRDGPRIASDSEYLSDDALVSMNLWGFDPSVIRDLEPIVDQFTRDHMNDAAELNLPDAVALLIESGAISVTVIPTRSKWVGITFPQDAESARATMRELVDSGAYPETMVQET